MKQPPDRLPPHSFEAEQGILGSVLLDPNLAPELKIEWFYDLRHRTISEAIQSMVESGAPVDTISLVQSLRQADKLELVGGVAYVSALPDMTPSAANFTYWRGILQECALLRSILRTASDYTSRAHEPGADARTLLNEFERDALAIRTGGGSDHEPTLREQLIEVHAEFEACFANQGKLRGLPSGFPDLDAMTSGFRDGQLIIIAARPSAGKTSLAMNMVERCAIDEGISTGVFSLEMSAKELLFRLACCRARVSSREATSGKLDQRDIDKLSYAMGQIRKAPLCIVDHGGLTIGRLASIARRIVQRHSIRLLIVDYLQLLRGSERRMENRVAEVTAISNGLKALARELNLPVICCAQLNRSSEKEGRKPFLSDLRDSGSIEQDADIVLLLHRSESDGGDIQPVEVIVAKHRNGPTGFINLQFRKTITRFESYSA